MRVICIDNGPKKESCHPNSIITKLVEGNIYTVVRQLLDNGGDLSYILEEVKSCGYMGAFLATRFIPVSNIDEKELIKERELLTEKV